MFIDIYVMVTKKRGIVLKYLLKLDKFYAVNILTHGLSKFTDKNICLIQTNYSLIIERTTICLTIKV